MIYFNPNALHWAEINMAFSHTPIIIHNSQHRPVLRQAQQSEQFTLTQWQRLGLRSTTRQIKKKQNISQRP